MENQITPSQQKNILETMGVRDGNVENISTSKIVKERLAREEEDEKHDMERFNKQKEETA